MATGIKCPKCDMKFISKFKLQEHLKKQHEMSQNELKAIVDWLGSLEAQ